MKNSIKNYPGLFVFIFVFVLGTIMSPAFCSINNIAEILQSCAENGLLAAGMTLVIIGGGGGVDLSVGSNVALGCMIAALTQVNWGVPIAVSLILSMLVCGVFGALNGLMVTKGKLQPFVATLVGMIGIRAIALMINNGMPVSAGIPESYMILSRFKIGPVFLPAYLWIAAIIFLHIVLTRTKFGRNLVACGGNEEAANYTGIRVERVRFASYMILGLLAGIAGAILTSRLMIGEPRSGSGYEMLAIAAVVMGGTPMSGGRGSLIGTLFGVLALSAITNLLNVANVNMYLQQVVEGVIVLAAVLIPSCTAYLSKRTSRREAARKLL